MAEPTVVAAVLTRNRMDLLRQSLNAIREQTRPVDELIVVDNESSDGTVAMLHEEFPDVTLIALAENQGATGGFWEAIAAAHRAGADWLWLLDDDSIARPTALAELLAALDRLDGERSPALLCSRVEWKDGNPHVMNFPVFRGRNQRELAEALRAEMLPVRAVSWVSLFLSRAAVDRVGLPPRHFFYQADDIEYTARILRDAKGYYVPASVVEHRTPGQHTAIHDDHRFYFHIRNTILMLRGRAWRAREKPALVWVLVSTSVIYLRINHLSPRSVKNWLAALVAGVRLPLDRTDERPLRELVPVCEAVEADERPAE